MENGSGKASSSLEALESTLEALSEHSRQIGVIAQDYQARSSDTFATKLQSLVAGLQELDAAKHGLQDVKVPMSVLGYLDSGKNPLLATEESLRRSLDRNKELNGKLELYRKFRASLLAELSVELPVDAATYRTCRLGRPSEDSPPKDEGHDSGSPMDDA